MSYNTFTLKNTVNMFTKGNTLLNHTYDDMIENKIVFNGCRIYENNCMCSMIILCSLMNLKCCISALLDT